MMLFQIKQHFKHRLKVKYKKGHGVHSPFFFHLITSVIENKHEYYAYEELKFQFIKAEKSLKLDQLRLIFRLVNSFKFQNIFILGNQAYQVEPYIKKAKSLSYTYIASTPNDIKIQTLPDFVILTEPLSLVWMPFLNKCSEKNISLHITNINNSKRQYDLWKSLASQFKHAIELPDSGLLFSKEEVPQQKYKY